MKIGIITFHFVSNQGAVLQCLATQKFLENNGHEAFVINYKPAYHTIRYVDPKNPFLYAKWYFKKFKNRKTIIRLLLTIRSFIRCIYYNIKHADADVSHAYGKFVLENLNLTREYHSLKDLRTDAPEMDAYITGSDQLWNPDILDQRFDPAYFLAFGDDIPKISYAVSLGKDLEENEIRELNTLCKNLSAISLREYDKNVVDSLGRDIHICLDPTLLLNAEDYTQFESNEIEEEPYIFVYGFENTSSIHEAVNIARNEFHCKVINGSPHRIKLDGSTDSVRVYAPDRFLSFIKNAECIVTNSFHGTAFSIVYKKRFITVPHSTRGRRMKELLEKTELNQCLFGHPDFDFSRDINWERVYHNLNYYRKFSSNYILSAIEGKPNNEIPHADGENIEKNNYDQVDYLKRMRLETII